MMTTAVTDALREAALWTYAKGGLSRDVEVLVNFAKSILDEYPVTADWIREEWGFGIWDSESRTWFLKNTEVRWRDGITYMDTIPVGGLLNRGQFTALMFAIGRVQNLRYTAGRQR